MKIQFNQIKISNKTIIISALCVLIFTGCSKNEFSGILKDAVYVAGNINSNAGVPNTVFWRNDSIKIMPGNGLDNSENPAIFVDGSDVYMTRGCYESPSITVARYWKNGISHDLTSGAGVKAYSHSIFVKDGDVYVAGEIGSPYAMCGACYWKNGVVSYLAKVPVNASARAIFVYKNDVYVAGYEYEQQCPFCPIYMYATYWKNGKAVHLNEQSLSGFLVTSIYVSNGDVYVGGSRDTYAVYWKNGTEVKLTDGIGFAKVNSVFVFGNDVYAAGFARDSTGNQVPTYWRNGTPIYLTDQRYLDGEANSIFVTANGVYVAGTTRTNKNYIATYWKNGVPVFLTDETKGFGSGTSIYVKAENW